MSHSERFYVYVYRVDGGIAYVGKGQGARAWEHLNGARNPILRQRLASARNVKVRIIRHGMSEADAFRLERRCINKWRGTLCNLTQGTRTQTEAIWHDCLNDLQNNLVSYGFAYVTPRGVEINLQTGEGEEDTPYLRIRNLMWIKRRLRKMMRLMESLDAGLVS